MKTAQEFYKEISGSQKLLDELNAARNREALGAFLRDHGCGADADEFTAFVNSQTEGEIADDEAEAAAGGHIAVEAPPQLIPW